MNCLIASSVCGEVGLAAIELEDAREAVAAPKVLAIDDVDEAIPVPVPEAPVEEDGS